MYCHAYVLGCDGHITRQIHSFLLHPETEARTTRDDAIIRFLIEENQRQSVWICNTIDKLLHQRILDRSEGWMGLDQRLEHLWNDKIMLDIQLDKLLHPQNWGYCRTLFHPHPLAYIFMRHVIESRRAIR